MWKTEANECLHAFVLEGKFFSWLQDIDREIAHQVAQAGCRWCGGPLDRSDYARKPRGDQYIGAGVELPSRRISYCCRRAGCRRRATPPSVVFLGRRVYLGVVVIVASALALSLRKAALDCPPTEVPRRTLRRWSSWWQTELTVTTLFAVLRGQLASPVDTARLPISLLERLGGGVVKQLTSLLKLLAPLTTGSVSDGARFLRGVGVE